jgi:hypothetical protein
VVVVIRVRFPGCGFNWPRPRIGRVLSSVPILVLMQAVRLDGNGAVEQGLAAQLVADAAGCPPGWRLWRRRYHRDR